MKRKRRKSNIDNKKIFIGLSLLILSLYFSTFIHESGHAISVSFMGCSNPQIYVSPLLIGSTSCLFPEDLSLSDNQFLVFVASGPIFVLIIGIILMLINLYSKKIKKNYFLNLGTYFFSFSCLGNAFLQFIKSGDLSEYIELGLNPNFSYILALISGFLILVMVLRFSRIIEEVKINSSNRSKKIIQYLWVVSILLYFISYLFII